MTRLCLFLLLSVGLFAADPKVGDTREEVVRLMGKPEEILPLAAGGNVFCYPRGEVYFNKNGVSRLDLLSDEEFKKKEERKRRLSERPVVPSKTQLLSDFCKTNIYIALRRPGPNERGMVMLGDVSIKSTTEGAVVSLRVIDTSTGGGGSSYYAWIRLLDKDQQTVAQVRQIYLPVGGGVSEVPLWKFGNKDWDAIGKDPARQLSLLQDATFIRLEQSDSRDGNLIETSTSVRKTIVESK